MKILFAGAQNTEAIDMLIRAGAKNLLMSFYYMRKMSDEMVEKIMTKAQDNECFVMLDSGAHTYFSYHGESLFHRKHIASQASGVAKAMDKNYVPPDQFIKDYIEFLKKWADYFGCYVELDIGTVGDVGLGKVLQWREDMANAGLTPVPVLHFGDSDHFVKEECGGEEPGRRWRTDRLMKFWAEMCSNYPYVGLEGAWKYEDYVPFLRESDKTLTKVHGFAMTNKKVFRYLPFYSVDSTSWNAGQMYGVTYLLNGEELKLIDKDRKSQRQAMKPQCEELGVDHDAFMADKREAVTMFNIGQWIKYQEKVDWFHRNDRIVLAEGDAPLVEAKPPPTIRELEEGATIGRTCDVCYIADQCSFFQQGAACSVPFAIPNAESAPAPADMLNQVMAQAFERVQFGLAMEKTKGGLLNPEVSKELHSFVNLVGKVRDINAPAQEELVVKAKGQGIIAKLFGGYGKAGGTHPAMKIGAETPQPLESVVDNTIEAEYEVQDVGASGHSVGGSDTAQGEGASSALRESELP